MGRLVDGKWQDHWYDTEAQGGRFVRWDSPFRNWVGGGRFPAAAGRYHLYVSLACPWAHRTLIVRALKGLEDTIPVSIVAPIWDEGWSFDPGQGGTEDALYGARHMHEIYTRAVADFSGRATVPVLWDSESATIVNNESTDIVRMLNSAFDAWGRDDVDLYPEHLRAEIDALNGWIYSDVNNGVYRAGFATTQEAYEEAIDTLFDALDRLEARLAGRRYLVGDQLTEAAIRLFTTLVRFDAVFVGHFKCNRWRIVDYPNLSAYVRDIHQIPGIAGTVDIDHIKRHYYGSHSQINPTGIVPAGPELDFSAPQVQLSDQPRLIALI